MKTKKLITAQKLKRMKSKEFIQQSKDNKYNLGRRIVGLRKLLNNMSRETLSDLSGICIDTLIKIERGLQMLSVDKLNQIAIVFGITIVTLCDSMTFKYQY